MSKIEKTCENCKYEYESVDGFHCINCIHNAHNNFKPKAIYESEQDIYERAYAEGRDKGYSCGEFSGYNKAIDEFLNKIYDVSYFVREPKLISGGYSVVTLENIEKIAEQLKVGET